MSTPCDRSGPMTFKPGDRVIIRDPFWPEGDVVRTVHSLTYGEIRRYHAHGYDDIDPDSMSPEDLAWLQQRPNGINTTQGDWYAFDEYEIEPYE